MGKDDDSVTVAFDTDIADAILIQLKGLCKDNVPMGVFHLMAVIASLVPTYEGATFLLEQVYKFSEDFEEIHDDCDEDRVIH